MAAPASTISVRLPADLLGDLDFLAAAKHATREEMIEESVRRFVNDLRWRMVQEEGARRAREAGILTEDDVEEFLDSLPDE